MDATNTADEYGLLPIGPNDHPDPHSMVWSDTELRAIRRYAEMCVGAERERWRGVNALAQRLESATGVLTDENERLRAALRLAREGYASEEATGLPVLPQWRESTMARIDEALGA